MSAQGVEVLTKALADQRAHATHHAGAAGYWRQLACTMAEEAGRLRCLLAQRRAQGSGLQGPDALHVVANLHQHVRLLADPNLSPEEMHTGLRELEAGLARLRGMVITE